MISCFVKPLFVKTFHVTLLLQNLPLSVTKIPLKELSNHQKMYSICNQLKGLSQNTKNRIPSRSHTKSLIRSRINISGSINAAAADDYKKAMNFHEPSKQSLPTVEPIDPAAGGLSFSFRTGRPSQPFGACDTGDWFRPYEIQKRAALSLGFFTTDCHTCVIALLV